MTSALSDKILVVGKKGEIFTTKEIRVKAGLKEGGRVRATVVAGKLVVEAVPSLEEVLRTPLLKVGVRKAERLSEKTQKEQGVFG
jgi:bifunctional DNA-binding transcriptional regulator/antitoxin component of YhaV-PrlF toxin-antitoxin module